MIFIDIEGLKNIAKAHVCILLFIACGLSMN